MQKKECKIWIPDQVGNDKGDKLFDFARRIFIFKYPFQLLFGIWTLVFGIICAFSAHAALLYLTPQSGEHQPGDSFGVEVHIDNETECINAGEVTVTYAAGVITAVDTDLSDSIFSLWIKNPTIDQEKGMVSFIGGIPGGYCGRIPGDPGVSNILARIIFRVPGFRVGTDLANAADIGFLEESQILLNDGQATKAVLTFQGARVEVVEKGETITNEWIDRIKEDTVPPEIFKVELQHDPAFFDGKYVVIFSTIDKQTGIDHFEVLEADAQGNVAGTLDKAAWKSAHSPYTLEDQKLHSIITVKAIDKAGNERLFEYVPPGFAPVAGKKQIDLTPWILGAAGVFALFAAGLFILRWLRRRGKPVGGVI